MIIILLLSLHVLLILIYALMIELKKSRHTYLHLLFAAAVPLAGELCLFASEFGRTESGFKPERLFRYERISKKSDAKTAMDFELPVTREALLEALEKQPENLVTILKKGIESDDVEVVHISAATIMKLQRQYENRISSLREEYSLFEDNTKTLREYISAVGEYYDSGLLEGESARELLVLQEDLLTRLLRVLPEDAQAKQCYADNQRKQTEVQINTNESYEGEQ